jgi:hypothetical protein
MRPIGSTWRHRVVVDTDWRLRVNTYCSTDKSLHDSTISPSNPRTPHARVSVEKL